MPRRQHLMHPMAQFMCQGHHIARLSKVVQHHIWMHRRHGRMRKGPRCLARLDRSVDPAFGEERLGQFGHARIKLAIGFLHDGLRIGPVDDFGVFHRQRRVAVPDLHPVQTQPFTLQFIVAMRQAGIGIHNRIAQRLDHLGFHVVRQVTPRLRRRHLAPAVDDFLFLGLRVVDTGKGFKVVVEHAGQFAAGGLALGAVLLGQEVQRAFDIVGFTVDGEFQPRDGFIKQLFPGVPDHAEIMQEALKLVRQLVRFHRADAVEHRLIAGQIGICLQQAVQVVIVKAVQFEREKHQRRGEIGDRFLAVRHELGALGIGGHLVIAQARIGHDAPGDPFDLFLTLDTLQQTCGIQRGQLALVIRSKRRAFALKPVQIAGQFRCVVGGVKIRQVPLGQIAQIVSARHGVGVADREWQVQHWASFFEYAFVHNKTARKAGFKARNQLMLRAFQNHPVSLGFPETQ